MRQDYRLLVLDLDGTLTNSKKEISTFVLYCVCNKAAYAWCWLPAVPPTVLFPWRNSYK